MKENLQKILDDLRIVYQQIGRKKHDGFNFIKDPANADENSLIFVNKPDETTLKLLSHSHCSVVILEQQWGIKHLNKIENLDISIFLVDNPRLVVTQIMRMLYPDDEQCFSGVHSTAQVHCNAEISATASIGAHSIIKDNVKIGNNVTIHEFCLIGGCGFGFVRFLDGHAERTPHFGVVVIEDDVEVFPYVNIDRGTFGETRIKRGAKIDRYVHISHNSVIGEDCIITAGAVFCGGSRIGKQSWVGVGSIIKEKVCIGDNVIIGLGSVVIRDVENNMVIAGIPAKPLKEREK